MALQIIEAKVQAVYVAQKEKISVKRAANKGTSAEGRRRFRVIIGTRIEFNDGCTLAGPDGRIHKGTGTVVRFNFRHRTWSVQRPQSCETNRVGYVFTLQGDPCWLKAQCESGFTPREFARSFSAAFVKLCHAGQELAAITASDGGEQAEPGFAA